MSIATLSENEKLLLEVIEALGGEAQSHVLTALARPGIGDDVLAILMDLTDAGLLVASPTGRFMLTEAGQQVIGGSEAAPGRLTAWQRKQIAETARGLLPRMAAAWQRRSRVQAGAGARPSFGA